MALPSFQNNGRESAMVIDYANGCSDTVAIIGGGCSGMLMAISLLRNATRRLIVSIVEKRLPLGQGLAYSTKCNQHVLNVPSQSMSALADDPNHFLNWLRKNNMNCDPINFIARCEYARYLQDSLQEAIDIGKSRGCFLEVIQDEAVALSQKDNNTWGLELLSGQKLVVDNVVLALGVFLGESLGPKHITNPWQIDLTSWDKTSNIAIVGSGLSAVDVLLSLKTNDWQGKITVLSRNGVMPLAHNLVSYSKKLVIEWQVNDGPLALFRQVEDKLKFFEQQGYPWQSVVDSLRPYTQTIWQNWDDEDKKLFIHYLRHTWNVHRHRIAPQVAQQISKLQEEGFFAIREADFNETTREAVMAEFDYVIDCSGLQCDYSKVKSSLLQNMFAQGLIKQGPLGRGIMANKNGSIRPNLHVMGYALHGTLWESIAVPELRTQANSISQSIDEFASRHNGFHQHLKL